MLKKQKMKAQVRRSLIGATSAGSRSLLKSARLKPLVTAVMISEATRKPMTNFGKRHQISARLAARHAALPPRRRDDRQDEGPNADPDVAPDHLHQGEGEDRLILVPARLRGRRGCRRSAPRRSPRRRRIPRCRSRRRRRRPGDAGSATKGSTKIMTIAQTITTVMAIGACSFLAPTAPAMAMAAETPQTAPPAPSVAARRRSRPSSTRPNRSPGR